MEWNRDLIGTNAGIVWRSLAESNVALSWENLLSRTGLDPLDQATAIGWLMKEDKICICPHDGKLLFGLYQIPYF